MERRRPTDLPPLLKVTVAKVELFLDERFEAAEHLGPAFVVAQKFIDRFLVGSGPAGFPKIDTGEIGSKAFKLKLRFETLC